jgi:myo-inositol-1(or 4)-monophosphatase
MLADEEFIAQFRAHVVSTTLAVLGSPLDAAPPISLMVTYATACSSRRESRCARPPAASSLGFDGQPIHTGAGGLVVSADERRTPHC